MPTPRFSIRLLLVATTLVAVACGFLPWFHEVSLEHALLVALTVQFLIEASIWGFAHASRTFLTPSESEDSENSD